MSKKKRPEHLSPMEGGQKLWGEKEIAELESAHQFDDWPTVEAFIASKKKRKELE